MTPIRNLLGVASLLLVPLFAQQEPQTAPSAPPATKAPAESVEVDQWIAELGSDSYRKRVDAERKLRKLGAAAVPALKKAASAEDAEVQWRAARVLRQIEGDGKPELQERRGEADTPPATPGAPGRSRLPGRVDGGAMREQFESLFEQFEREFGIDIPRARFFGDGFFRDLQDQMKTGNGNAQGMSVQIGPDGAVHVEVDERNEKGEVEKKVYDAPDMETFKREHPGVLQQNGLGLGLSPWRSNTRVWSGPVQPGWRMDVDPLQSRVVPFDGTQQLPAPDAAPAPIAGRRLGVSIRPEISADLRDHLGLPDGVGLMVEGVQEESLAKRLGLERGDIVTAIAGRTIGSSRDVQEALAPIAQDHEVEVKFVRKGQERTAKANKPEPAAPFEAKGKLEKRSKGEAVIR